MLALFDDYEHRTRLLARSLRIAGVPHTPVVIRCTGLPPEGVRSPIAEYTGLRGGGEPLFFDEVPVPPWCEIRQGREPFGEILRDGARIARIRYEPNSYRRVERVEWVLPDGTLSHAEHYDRSGSRYAVTHYAPGRDGRVIAQQTVYSGPGPWRIDVDHGAKTVIMRSRTELRAFPSVSAFVAHFVTEQGIDAERILINSLSYPLFTSWLLADEPNTTLFWQEPMPGEVPGNMVAELERPRALTRIVFGEERLRRKVAARHPGTPVALDTLSPLDQFAEHRGYEARRVFTLTNSDELPALPELLEALPGVRFVVAALTLMSERLHELGRRHANLTLIPTASRRRIREELDRASVYLDVNAGSQVLDAVPAAYHLGLVVLAHAPVAKSPAHALVCAGPGELRERLATATAGPEGRAAELAELQAQACPLSTPADYRRLLPG